VVGLSVVMPARAFIDSDFSDLPDTDDPVD